MRRVRVHGLVKAAQYNRELSTVQGEVMLVRKCVWSSPYFHCRRIHCVSFCRPKRPVARRP
jgi:hypothetical protein